uniref:Uncharacterized protein n=1 Tax=Plectus sambesii TaxID=2011161 RepID=A0A914XRE8_9BILA
MVVFRRRCPSAIAPHRLEALWCARAQATAPKTEEWHHKDAAAFRALSTAVGTAAEGRKSASPLERDHRAIASFRPGVSLGWAREDGARGIVPTRPAITHVRTMACLICFLVRPYAVRRSAAAQQSPVGQCAPAASTTAHACALSMRRRLSYPMCFARALSLSLSLSRQALALTRERKRLFVAANVDWLLGR